MENFNLALLSAPVAMKDMSNDIQALPQKSSEKEFSGILAREENQTGTLQDGVENQPKQRKLPVEHDAEEASTAGNGAVESSDKITNKTDDNTKKDTQEIGTNVITVVPVADVTEEVPVKIGQLTEFADDLKAQALLTETSEGVVVQATQIEDSELSVFSDVSLASEILTVQKGMLTRDNRDNELNDSDVRLFGETVDSDSVAKLFPANIAGEVATEEVVEKVAAELPTSGSKVEFSVVDSENKKTGLIETPEDESLKLATPKVAASPKVEVSEVESLKLATPKVAASPKVEVSEVESLKLATPKVAAPKVESSKVTVAQNIVSDIAVAADSSDSVAGNSAKDGLHQGQVVEQLSSQSGISLDELPADVEIRIESGVVVSDEKMQRKADISTRMTDKFPSARETGMVHLQGRARENQPSLMQNGQGQKDATAFAEEENSYGQTVSSDSSADSRSLFAGEVGTVHSSNQARENQPSLVQNGQGQKDANVFAVGEENHHGKAAFMDELKTSVSEKISVESTVPSRTNEKPVPETTLSKTPLLAEFNSDFKSTHVVKKGTAAMSAKSLPISDEHLLDQIHAGLTRSVNGRQTVTIKLWPEHLGRVDVKLVMHKQHLTATFMVDHSEVKDAMLRKIDSLHDSLGLRGIDSKDISIKVAPARSGDGPSLMADNQPQNGNSAWRQFNQGGFTNGNSQSQPDFSENSVGESSLAETIPETVPYAGSGIDPGSLHITA